MVEQSKMIKLISVKAGNSFRRLGSVSISILMLFGAVEELPVVEGVIADWLSNFDVGRDILFMWWLSSFLSIKSGSMSSGPKFVLPVESYIKLRFIVMSNSVKMSFIAFFATIF